MSKAIPVPTVTERDRLADLKTIADAIISRAGPTEPHAWGLESKRPFGSSNFYGSVLVVLGVDPADVSERAMEKWVDYIDDLYDVAGDYIRRRWASTSDAVTAAPPEHAIILAINHGRTSTLNDVEAWLKKNAEIVPPVLLAAFDGFRRVYPQISEIKS